MRLITLLMIVVAFALSVGGCVRSRVVTISAIPPDARIRIDGNDRGRGPFTETFTFPSGVEGHTVQAEREGYRSQSLRISPDYSQESLVIDLKPEARRVTFSVSPMPAIVRLDGRTLSSMPVTEVAADLSFRIDAAGRWNTHQVTAEREGFDDIKQTLTYDDAETVYKLELGVKQKDLQITTTPAQADVYLNDKLLGKSPIDQTDVSFPVDPQTDAFAPQKLRIEKAGYETYETEISWDGGKTNYEIPPLKPQSKIVRINTVPPDATVVLGGVELKRDPNGTAAVRLEFGPRNDRGDTVVYFGEASRQKSPESEWEPASFRIGWDQGETDYTIELTEILVRRVPMLRLRMVRADGGWTVTGERATTSATKDITDGPASKPEQITRLPRDTMIDSLDVAPDGSRILFTTLSDGSGELRSQIHVQKLDGPSDTTSLTDGSSLEIMPMYTPEGSRVVFSSNRAGRKLSIWSVSAKQPGVPEQLTMGDSNDLWPSVDSNPKPRLFYESRIDTRPEPRLFARPLEAATPRADLTPPAGGGQPRVGPVADAVLFTVADEKTGKRDIYRMSDIGGDVTNLTNSPDADDFDPAWSPDGQRFAFVSDRGRSPDAPDNYDLWTLDAVGAAEPVRVTSNESWDDCPAWDFRGRSLYFRSNRGGQWNVWRIDLK